MDFFTAGLGARPLPARFHYEEEGLAGAACRRNTPEPRAQCSGLRSKAHELYLSTPIAVHLFQARRPRACAHDTGARRVHADCRCISSHACSAEQAQTTRLVVLEFNESNP